MYSPSSNNPSVRGLNLAPPTASTTSAASSKATSRGSTNDVPLSASSTKTSFRGGTRASSAASSWRRRRSSFHVTSFALSVACKLLTVHRPPPPLYLESPSTAATSPSSTQPSSIYPSSIYPSSPTKQSSTFPSTAPSMLSLIESAPTLKPLKVYGDIIGPQLCKVVLVIKELGLPYVLKVFDHGTNEGDPYETSAYARAVPALDDPNTELILWESGAIIEYLEETYDKDNRLRYTTFPENYHQKQWAWHLIGGGHESLLGRRAFISVHDYYENLIRGNLATIEDHLSSTGNLYLIGDRVTYADIMYIAAKEAMRTVLRGAFEGEFESEWRREWPRSYDWHMRLMQRFSVREFFKERGRIIEERGWLDLFD